MRSDGKKEKISTDVSRPSGGTLFIFYYFMMVLLIAAPPVNFDLFVSFPEVAHIESYSIVLIKPDNLYNNW